MTLPPDSNANDTTPDPPNPRGDAPEPVASPAGIAGVPTGFPLPPGARLTAPAPPSQPASTGGPDPVPVASPIAPPLFGAPPVGASPMPPGYGPPGYGPPWMGPPRPAPRKSSKNTWIVVLVVVAVGAFLLFQIRAATSGMSRGGALQEVAVNTNVDMPKVVLLELSGIILDAAPSFLGTGVNPVRHIRAGLEQATADPNVAAIVLGIDSPGGGVTASDVLYHEIVEFKTKMAARGQPVKIVVLQRDLAASGGYYVSCAADRIIAHPTTITGSIGVVMQGFNFSGAMEKLGIDDATITSVPNKDVGSPFRPQALFERERLRRLLLQMQDQFETAVFDGRSAALKERGLTITRAEVTAFADGSVYTAQDALRLKLIDAIGYEADAIAEAQRLIGARAKAGVHVVRYEARAPSLFPFAGLRSNPGAAEALSEAARRASESGAIAKLLDRAGPRIWALWLGGSD